MRALLSKILTGSMVAGAALLVSACGGHGDEAANNAMTSDLGTDSTLDTTNDVTAIDAGTGADANMATDAMTTDIGGTSNTTDAGNMTNGM
ncbi:MAG: hypothetical protein JWN69_1528 [Alphaproteobacteria bacterium]|nr:hypothetical protein [Alphaproteobacteria bacterium]